MLNQLRIAFRTLVKSPGFSLVVVLTLALGIGANTAIFSVVNSVLLNPIGIAIPERVVSLRVRYDKLNLKSINMSAPDFADVRDSKQVFDHAALVDEQDFIYTAGATPERLQGAAVLAEYFDVFGAKPRLGRVFRPEEDQPNANQEVVLSYAAWKRLFGADPNTLGKTFELNNQLYRVIGVMGPDFRWPMQVDLWVPIGLASRDFQEDRRFWEGHGAVARLKAGNSLQQANSLIQILANRVRHGAQNGAYAKDSMWGMFAMPITDYMAGDSKKPLLVLLTAVGLVLLIACSNIAGLMLARASARSREVAVRSALGAGRWDLIRQTLLETSILSIAGASLGFALSQAGVVILLSLAPKSLAAGLVIPTDWRVLAFTAGLTIFASLLFAVAPALHGMRATDYAALKEGGRSGTAGSAKQRTRALLVIAEVALALVLLVGAGLFLRSLSHLRQAGTGFDPQHVLTAMVSLPETRYKEPEKRIAFYRAVTDRLSSSPGVSAATAAFSLPFSGVEGSGSFSVEGRNLAPGEPAPHADIRWVGPGYFRTLRIPQRSGRVFTEQDRKGGDPVVIIDENLARQYWPKADPVGKHLRQGRSSPWRTIVGVVGHLKHSDIAGDTGKGVIYYPIFQEPTPFTSFAVRTGSDPASLTVAMRNAVKSIDPSLPVHHIKTMEDMVSASLEPRRFVVSVLGFFALVALLLAALGLYGVISYSVAQRTQEIGIRMALGAQQREVLTMVAGQGLRLAVAGVVIGFVSALLLSGFVSSQLFGISAFDPLTFALTAAVLIAAALLASYVPARRAAKVDPMVALRYE